MSVLNFRRQLLFPDRFIWEKFDLIGNSLGVVSSDTFDFPFDGERDGYRYVMVRGSPPMITWGIYSADPVYGYNEKDNGTKTISISSASNYIYGTDYTFDDVGGTYTITKGVTVRGSSSFVAVAKGTGGLTLREYTTGETYEEESVTVGSGYSVHNGKFSLTGTQTLKKSQVTASTKGYILTDNILGEITSVSVGSAVTTINTKTYSVGSVFAGKYFQKAGEYGKIYSGYSMTATYSGTARERGTVQSNVIVGYKKGSVDYGKTSSPNPDLYPANGRDESNDYWYQKEAEAPYQFDDRDLGV